MKKILASTMPMMFLLACGGSAKKPAAPAPRPMPAAVVEKKPPPEPEPPPPPPPPKEWHATARLDPVKGVKMPAFEVGFVQVEGESTRARTAAAIAKLKAGSYHLIVHEGTECGPKGNKVGAVRVDLSDGALVVATRKQAPSVDVENGAIALDGDSSIVGHALVLHADKRGKVGAAVACGIVVAAETTDGDGDGDGGGGDGDGGEASGGLE